MLQTGNRGKKSQTIGTKKPLEESTGKTKLTHSIINSIFVVLSLTALQDKQYPYTQMSKIIQNIYSEGTQFN